MYLQTDSWSQDFLQYIKELVYLVLLAIHTIKWQYCNDNKTFEMAHDLSCICQRVTNTAPVLGQFIFKTN